MLPIPLIHPFSGGINGTHAINSPALDLGQIWYIALYLGQPALDLGQIWYIAMYCLPQPNMRRKSRVRIHTTKLRARTSFIVNHDPNETFSTENKFTMTVS